MLFTKLSNYYDSSAAPLGDRTQHCSLGRRDRPVVIRVVQPGDGQILHGEKLLHRFLLVAVENASCLITIPIATNNIIAAEIISNCKASLNIKSCISYLILNTELDMIYNL